MKVHCEDCKWYSNAWGQFDCYESTNNVYTDSSGSVGVRGIKKHGWEINKNNDCEKYEDNDDGIDTRDLLKRCKKYVKDFKIGGKVIK